MDLFCGYRLCRDSLFAPIWSLTEVACIFDFGGPARADASFSRVLVIMVGLGRPELAVIHNPLPGQGAQRRLLETRV